MAVLAPYCPQAKPIERTCRDVHDQCSRNHPRQRSEELVGEVEQHVSTNGPWPYKLSHLYFTLEVTTAVECLVREQRFPQAA